MPSLISSEPTRQEPKAVSKPSLESRAEIASRRILIDLFPHIEPYASGFLQADSIHNIYWEQSGNPDGVPVLILHGGPGAGSSPKLRRFFDPDHYRIILFDQRGCGRSTPMGALENNGTEFLIKDIEMLKKHLKIDQWHLFGGSWGSTLALRYAIKNPDHCISLILRGIFLCEKQEIDWFLYGIKKIFPEAWEQFISHIPPEEQNDLLEAYYKRLTDPNRATRIEAAICWALYEGACASLVPNYEIISTEEQKQNALTLAKLEAHFFKHEMICGEERILRHIDKIRHIPAMIVQGRYDIICPLETAHKLHQAWPEADYVIVPDAGHSSSDPPLRSQLVSATENFKRLK